jgi:hypothetical protein
VLEIPGIQLNELSSSEEDDNAWRDPFYEFRDIRVHQVRSEIDRYLEEPLIDRSKKDSYLRVVEYWKANQNGFPILSQMAGDFLAIPATSVLSERVFSQGSDLITKKRNRIGGNNTQYVLCLRIWGIYEEDVDGS